MILAAGLGTRLKPITDKIPKALVEINGKTLLEHSIEHLKIFGITEAIINVHHFPDQIISFLKKKKNFGMRIEVSDERDQLLDTLGRNRVPSRTPSRFVLARSPHRISNSALTDGSWLGVRKTVPCSWQTWLASDSVSGCLSGDSCSPNHAYPVGCQVGIRPMCFPLFMTGLIPKFWPLATKRIGSG